MKANSGIVVNSNRRSAYSNFSENLLKLSVKNESIAKTCRDLNINRQQFNKYLSGQVLPNAETLERITEHFNIDALELFKPPYSDPAELNTVTISTEKTNKLAVLKAAVLQFESKPAVSHLEPGVYSYYMPYESDTSKCMRGFIAISVNDGVTFFSRVMRYSEFLSGQNYSRKNVCDGVVTQTSNKLMMIGRYRNNDHTISLLNVDTNNKVDGLYWIGLLTAFSMTSLPTAVRTIFYHVGSIETWQQHFKHSGILKLDDLTIPNELRSMIKDQFIFGEATLYTYDVHKRWREN